MEKNTDNEIDWQAWKEEMIELIKQSGPQKMAYQIIHNFFNLNNIDDKTCEQFKAWFTDRDHASDKSHDKKEE